MDENRRNPFIWNKWIVLMNSSIFPSSLPPNLGGFAAGGWGKCRREMGENIGNNSVKCFANI
jgi:hypothetical protein